MEAARNARLERQRIPARAPSSSREPLEHAAASIKDENDLAEVSDSRRVPSPHPSQRRESRVSLHSGLLPLAAAVKKDDVDSDPPASTDSEGDQRESSTREDSPIRMVPEGSRPQSRNSIRPPSPRNVSVTGRRAMSDVYPIRSRAQPPRVTPRAAAPADTASARANLRVANYLASLRDSVEPIVEYPPSTRASQPSAQVTTARQHIQIMIPMEPETPNRARRRSIRCATYGLLFVLFVLCLGKTTLD